jgi:signal transduction histidine kinase
MQLELPRFLRPTAAQVAAPITLIALAHQAALHTRPFWSAFTEQLYLLPVLWAAFRRGWHGGLLAGVFCALVLSWISTGLPNPDHGRIFAKALFLIVAGAASGFALARWQGSAAEMANLKSELRESNRLREQSDTRSAAAELALGLAHELRHPAASIRGIASLLQDSNITAEFRAECLSILERECDRIERLLAGLLRFASPRAPQIEEADPKRIAESAIASVRFQAAKANIEIRSFVSSEVRGIPCDPALMQQLLVNLLLNAIQAMPHGGAVLLNVNRGLRSVDIQVVDEGTGIGPDLLDKVFLPFVTTRTDGTGLGLAVAKRIALQHGGTIGAQRNPAQGMTFTVTLPTSIATEAPHRV